MREVKGYFIGTCDCCNEDIRQGDEYVTGDGVIFHYDCFKWLTTDEFIKYLGLEKKVG